MQPMTPHGEGSEQNSFDGNPSAEYASEKVGLPELTPSTISAAIPSTTRRKTSKVYVNPAMTKRQAEKQDLAALMKQHGIFRKNGILYFPCTASEIGRRAVIEAIRNQ